VIDSIRQHRVDIESLCRRTGVRCLWLFGSALREDFELGRSDVDFLVDFGDVHPRPALQFHELREGLEAIFGTKIDIVSLRAVRNPYFRKELEETRQPLYVAA
jgi:predicted nucleotidyltransferase